MDYMQFALDVNDKVVDIAEVESGAKCLCTCLECNQPLVAKKGPKVVHHFAHYADTSCNATNESLLHKVAKHLLLSAKEIQVPEVRCAVYEKDGEDVFHELEIVDMHSVAILNAKLEVKCGDRVVDVLLETNEGPLAVEIAVTHFCDEAKIADIKNNGISCIEIDLSTLQLPYTLEKIRWAVIDSFSLRKWIYSYVENSIRSKLKLEINYWKKNLIKNREIYSRSRQLKSTVSNSTSKIKSPWNLATDFASQPTQNLPFCFSKRYPLQDALHCDKGNWRLYWFFILIADECPPSFKVSKSKEGSVVVESAINHICKIFKIQNSNRAVASYVLSAYLKDLESLGYIVFDNQGKSFKILKANFG